MSNSTTRPSFFRGPSAHSPNDSASRVPQVKDYKERIAHSNTSPMHSPPVTAPGSVRFPWEPVQPPTDQEHSTVNAAGLHSAFAHHPFHSNSHSRSGSREHVGGGEGDAAAQGGQHLTFDPNLPTGRDRSHTDGTAEGVVEGQHPGLDELQAGVSHTGIPMAKSHSLGGLSYHSTTTAASGIHKGATHTKDFPRSRTSSTGHGAMIGPDFGYRRKVGFETFDGAKIKDDSLFSYTLQAKSEDYRRNRNTRVFMAAVSNDEKGEDALDWLMDNLVEDGDEVVAVRVIELDEGEKASQQAQDEFREEAAHLLKAILEKNDDFGGDRRISVIVEFVAGKVTQTLMRLISLYRPDSLVVGTKGKSSKLQTWGRVLGAPGMGSVSRYCVSHSPVPVIVVRPERKVQKTLAKRQNDPKRGIYADMVGGQTLTRTRSIGERSIGDRSD
ncbi:hypothetical protein QFC21_002577 [Naganishia friedmannii]|uniref:Uncharacterized protein n=1 Tax=Naganishia friedmannii TaxID=89922 RepID=A0ACC2VWB5_9TREE|nr:hypothetical protein QFC21_002577 [Naganishia friedmannii]